MKTLPAAILLVTILAGPARGLDVKVTPNTARLTPYQVFELTFQHGQRYSDPNWDVTIDVQFTSPAGQKLAVGGFFYGSSQPQKPALSEDKDNRGRTIVKEIWPCDPADLWKARYAPSQLGQWKYAWAFKNSRNESAGGEGAFTVVKPRGTSNTGGTPVPLNHGWLRISGTNPHRWVHEDGTPFHPVGFQMGVHDGKHIGSVMSSFHMEGPFIPDASRPATPPGAMFVRGPTQWPVNGDVYFARFARAGFNVWRFSPNNATPVKLFASPQDQAANSRDHVRWEQGREIDEMLQLACKYGVRNFYGFFGYMDVCARDLAKDKDRDKDAYGRPLPDELAKVKRMIKYSVDRWGAYVDIWEFLNEQKADAEWYKMMIPYLQSVDPYRKPVSTSWERPEIAGITVNSPHTYVNEDELDSDAKVAGWATQHKRAGKIVMLGEQGNRVPRGALPAKGIGGVWDPGSARRMRVRLWSAMFNEISFIFWDTSYAKDGHNMNQWIGPQERQYVKALQDFSSRMDAGVKMAPVALAGASAGRVRAHGLRSGKGWGVYLHQFACDTCAKEGRAIARHRWDQPDWEHDRGQVKELTITLDVPVAAKAYWYSPLDGSILATANAPAGRQKFAAPPFSEDLALLVTTAGPPDADGDGKPNDIDDDDDNDGVPDAKDAFPLEREETADADGDRIGDSLDADVDADGRPDDLNRDGKPDNGETDPDGDGVPTAGAIPWDVFPLDPKETRDTDGDGIGDNGDTDDDGDGFSDAEEQKAGTDPLSPVSFPE